MPLPSLLTFFCGSCTTLFVFCCFLRFAPEGCAGATDAAADGDGAAGEAGSPSAGDGSDFSSFPGRGLMVAKEKRYNPTGKVVHTSNRTSVYTLSESEGEGGIHLFSGSARL